ncbi:ribosomal-protein-alanine N-acetyltransferase [Hahella sp. CCB-MM4]|uniref:ribosomal protein S18-alanine N-acetyltransferase n=1 Tax=Hahella sp. (strain CCB-MM4) TaxID=1926491 RepID=UPI000B9AC172|nr:ribosomal protein S18-alanine N-acetyltransferase [Hahella sp. CCB-MM4]OZG72022.1 ribosomal-protein-alanine N-acetyltransferase [Hahella sp. CCB-MM4]
MVAMTDTQQLQFRYMDDVDVSEVIANERSAYSHPWSEAVLRECLGGISECWVATMDKTIVGHGIISHVLDEGHLLNLCIGKSWQGQGLSHQFLIFLMSRLRELGVEKLFLEVRVSNEIAVALYKKHGFTQIGLRKAYYPAGSDREDAIVMAREIDSEIAQA